MTVRKALIPIAGKATRMMPISSVVPKAMLPLVNAANQIQCVLHTICQQAISAGIEHIGIVLSPQQIDMVARYFDAVRKGGFGELPAHIEYVTQEKPQGFGDAVLLARDFIGPEPFMLLLGDHIHIHDADQPPCTAQVARAFDCCNALAMIGVQSVSKEELPKVGVAAGVRIKPHLYRCTRFIEKPDLTTARLELATDGMPEDTFLAHSGIYVFSPEIFDCLSGIRTIAQKTGKEAELADAQVELLRKHPQQYFLCKIEGRAYDVGTPEGYARAQAAFAGEKDKESDE
ncbi:MAG TPA: sugar phosphate nucleotidyltransferase [Sedimentisphaerales bacterium]|nr:sugar phosphate nucleotidyltransferase [Sedimentisphaerales bacterium]